MEREAQNLAHLTGWSLETVRRRAGLGPVPHAQQVTPAAKSWWDRLWSW